MKIRNLFILASLIMSTSVAAEAAQTVCKVYVSPSCYTKKLKDQGYVAKAYVSAPDTSRNESAAKCIEYARDLLPYCIRKDSQYSQIWTKFEIDGVPTIGAAAYANEGKTYIYNGVDGANQWTSFHD